MKFQLGPLTAFAIVLLMIATLIGYVACVTARNATGLPSGYPEVAR